MNLSLPERIAPLILSKKIKKQSIGESEPLSRTKPRTQPGCFILRREGVLSCRYRRRQQHAPSLEHSEPRSLRERSFKMARQRRHVYHIQAKSTIPSEAGPLSRVYTPAASSPSVHAEKVNVGSFLVSFFGSVRGGSPFRSAGRHRARAPEASPSPPRQTLRTDPVDGERG